MPLPYELGRYRLVRPVSDDGRTAIGLYADASGQQVTVRTLSDAVASDPAAQQAFRQGAYAAGPVLDVGHAPDGRPFVVASAGAPPASPGYAPPGPGYGSPGYGSPGYGPGPSPTRKVWPIVAAVCAVLILVGGGLAAYFLTRGDGSDSDQADSTPSSPLSSGPSSQASSPSSAASTSPATPPADAAPQVGQCRELAPAAADAQSDSTPPIDCSQPHNAYTFYVGRYQGATPDNDYAGYQCLSRIPKALGITPQQAKLTAYYTVFFQPTSQQWAAGARWFRCDLAIVAGSSLRPLPASVTPFPKPPPDSLSACRSGDQRVPCSEAHSYRAYSTFLFGGSAPSIPGDKQLLAEAEKKCPGNTTYYTWPSASAWRYGDRIGVCWEQTTK